MQNTRTTTDLPTSQLPAREGTYDDTRSSIDKIILHTESYFVSDSDDAAHQAHRSKHYLVNKDGTATSLVPETHTAYHSGNYFVDQTSIGISCADEGNPNDAVRTAELYHAVAVLVYNVCKFYGIPIERGKILRHSEVSLKGSSCPDSLDVDRIVLEAQALDTVQGPTTEDIKRAEEQSTLDLYQTSVEQGKLKDERIKELERQVTDLEVLNTKLKRNVQEVTDSNAHLADELRKKNQEDSTAIDQGLLFEDRAKALQQDMHAIADALRAKPELRSILSALDTILGEKKGVRFKLPWQKGGE